MIKSRVYLAGALLAAAGAANAGVSVTPTVVSDYDFRGFTQTAKDPAFQLSVNYAHDSGFYAGIWGSNVDFGPGDPSVEVDLFTGFTGGDAAESFAYDVGAIYYSYVNASDFDYPEIYAGVTKGWFNAKVSYSWDWGGNLRPPGVAGDAFYVEGNATIPLPQGFALVAHVGDSFGGYWDDSFQGDGSTGGYLDFAVGVTKTLGHFALAVKYIDGSDYKDFGVDAFATGGKVVGSISTTLPWTE